MNISNYSDLTEKRGLDKALEKLRALLPESWRVKLRSQAKKSDRIFDGVFEITSPDGTTGTLLVEFKKNMTPQEVGWWELELSRNVDTSSILVVAPFLSLRVQEKLLLRSINYMDETGNVSLRLGQPGIVISTEGAKKNPRPTEKSNPTLKGPKAGRLVRALVDFLPPVGIRDLAGRAEIDAGYTSRIVRWLEEEDLVKRENGKVTEVKWQQLIRAWASNYSFLESNSTRTFLAPRGIPDLREKLAALKMPYVVTGSLAANEYAPYAPARAAELYTANPEKLAAALELRPLEGGGTNIILAIPFDPIVFERTQKRNGLTCAAPSQLAVDLLTGPGRNPAEAEALLKWMEKNESTWRG